MQQLDTKKYDRKNIIACAIAKWSETGQVSQYKYPEKFHEAIFSQGVIEQRKILNRRISRHRLKHQGNTKTLSGKVWMDYIWGALIVETCLQMMIDLWELRNEEVHSKEEATKNKRERTKQL